FLLLMLAVVGQFILSHRLGVPVTIAGTVVGTLSWWKDAILDWELIVFLVFALAISFISGQEQVRLEANHQQLTTIIALWRWNWCKQWPTSTITSVRVGWASVKIYRGRWRPSARIGGLSKREQVWLADRLREALGLPNS
ncbi:MAG: hypothetical protein NTU53_25550, partial [Planctomycetota bacterium]|nr:hypothetical protein [Planctomycetota bacterium]